MANSGTPTAILFLHVAHITTATTNVVQVTLLHHVIHFETRFGLLSIQWDGRLFNSYGNFFHIQIELMDLPSYFLYKANLHPFNPARGYKHCNLFQLQPHHYLPLCPSGFRHRSHPSFPDDVCPPPPPC